MECLLEIVNREIKGILRKYLLKSKIYKVPELLTKIGNQEEIHKFLSEFYTECEVKGVVLHKDILKFIIGYVVKYRLDNAPKITTEGDEGNISNNPCVNDRVKFLKYLLNEYKMGKDFNPIEIITLLKTIVRIMRPLVFDKSAPNLPWNKIQFVVCVFIGTKTDQTRLPDWLKDNYYQLLVTEEFVGKLLRLLLSRLDDDSNKAVDWSELDDIYNIAKIYYLILKMYWNVQTFLNDICSEGNERACLQMVGEYLEQLRQLNYEDFDDSIYVTQKMNFYSTILVEERHKLAHFQLIQIVRPKIEERTLKEFRTILADSVDKLLERVNQISIRTFPSDYYKNFELFQKIYKTLKDLNNKKNSNVVFGIGNKLMNILSLPIYENESFLNLVKNLKRKSEILKNRELSDKIITDLLNQFSPQPFVNIKTLIYLYLGLIPDSLEKRYLEDWTTNLCTDYVMENPKNADDETFIQNILIKIDKCIEDDNLKRNFAKKVSKLMRERCEFYENKIFNNSNSRRLRNYEIDSIVVNKTKNLSDVDIADIFLKQIKWENVDSVINKMKGEEEHHTNALNNDINKMNVLDLIELAKFKVDLTFDFNYLDFDCAIPVGRNLRNFLAHGDICIDIMCPDIKIVIDEHGNYFRHENRELSLGFSQPDDFGLVKDNFIKQMRWAREAWELLNWNNESKVLKKFKSDPMAFRVRDPAGLSIIQYSLKEINENNKFLKFLIGKLSNTTTESKENKLLEKLSTSYVPSNYDISNFNRNLLDYNSISFYINDLHKNYDGLILAQILCFNCPDIEIFKNVYSKIESNFPWSEWRKNEINREYDSVCGLLQIAVAQNQTEIIKYLLQIDHFQILINSNYHGFTALEYTIINGNVEMATCLIKNKAHVNHKLRYLYDNFVFNVGGLPFSTSLAYGDPEMLSLLESKGMNLDSEFIFDIQRKIKMNINPEVWTSILNSFCKRMDDFETFLHIACINEKFDIVKTIVETKQLDWIMVKETILMSCYNLKSPDIIEYLLHKGAILKLEHVKLMCMFGSIEVVNYLVLNDYLKEFSGVELIGRSQEIVGALLNANCQIDWKTVDFLPLQFILDQNQSDFITTRITFFLMHCSSQTKMAKQLKEMGIRIPLTVLEYIATELGLDKSNWLKECVFEETIEDWNEVLKTAVKCDHYLLAGIALKRGANINISIDNWTLLDFYIENHKGKLTEMMKMLSEFKCPSRFGIDFNNFTDRSDQLLFGHLTKNEDMVKNVDLNLKYSKFRDGTILHILYHYRLQLGKKEEDSPTKNFDNCTAFDLFVINNPRRPLPVNFSQISPFQRLIAGILRSNFKIMEDALNEGANINSVLDNFNLYPPLYVAVRENLTYVVEFLLRKGSNPNQKAYYQQLPIEASILSFDNDSVVELLLQHMTALTSNYLDYLLKLAKRYERKNVLKVLIQTKQNNLKTRTDFEVALNRGLDVNLVPNEYQETYLHIASYNNDYGLTNFLLEKGVDPLVRNSFNELPIHLAISKDHLPIVELFLMHNFASYNIDDLLRLSFKNNSIQTANYLLEKGAHINDDLIKFPCRMPNNGGLKLVKTLFKYDSNYKNYTKYFDMAVTNYNYVLAKTILLRTYQHSDIYLNDIVAFEEALKKGIDLDVGPELKFTNCKIPYLHYAALCCDIKIVEFLLENGADYSIKDSFARLPIEYAILLDDVEKVKLFYDNQPIFSFLRKSYNLMSLLILATKSNSLKSVVFNSKRT